MQQGIYGQVYEQQGHKQGSAHQEHGQQEYGDQGYWQEGYWQRIQSDYPQPAQVGRVRYMICTANPDWHFILEQ